MTLYPTIQLLRCNFTPAHYLAYCSQLELFRHFLGFPIPGSPSSLLQDVVVVGLDTEWWEKPPHPITELGFSVLRTRGLKALGPGPDATNILSKIEVYHARIRPYAHLMNHSYHHGDPENFLFGTTKFVTAIEARNLLLQMFRWPVSANSNELLPVVLLGHDIGNDMNMIQQHFGIDLSRYIAKSIDTQVLALEAWIPSPYGGWKIGLKALLKYFGIEGENLHTAGNDIAFTAIVSVLLALKKELYGSESNPLAIPGNGKSVQDVVRNLQVVGRAKLAPSWGERVFCTRCDSTEHLRAECRRVVSCSACFYSEDGERIKRAYSHALLKCQYGVHE